MLNRFFGLCRHFVDRQTESERQMSMELQTGMTSNKGFMTGYLEALSLVERLHRLLLDVIKDEFERVGVLEINAVQALLLFNIGDNEVTAGELKSRGYYQGSNVSYNLKKLVEMGYMHHQRCEIDRRSVRVRLTPLGRDVQPSCQGIGQQRCNWAGRDRRYHELAKTGRALLDRSDSLYLLIIWRLLPAVESKCYENRVVQNIEEPRQMGLILLAGARSGIWD